MELEWISKGPTHRCASLGNALITLWRGTPTVDIIARRVPWIRSSLKRGGALGYLIVVEESADGSQLPNFAFIAETRRQLELIDGHPAYSAMVVEGDGLVRSLVRTFMRGQARFGRSGQETRNFTTVRDAARWLGQQLDSDTAPTGSELYIAAEQMRSF